ncbi:hypothetical protein KFL_000120450 [Klebsormidium nitens]|uniref:Uncharacterized protein n=1 Tax=Klebsormidium nitens TaxID=105231 RepID=A0A1Y1HMH6_KLENI|nr:hypothetical protein KFL_000120450 [Klebsormidium nitens]|eukprot:GAQ78399.1 hypothetical protein KFL_000120450 [Klebsormidium nitens]
MAQHEEAARFLKMINEAAANNARGERLLESMRKEKALLRAKLDQASAEFESKKTDRRKSQEEYKTLSAQLLSIQATVSTKKEEKDNHRTLLTSKMQILNETLRRLHSENTDTALREELRKKQEQLAVLEEKAKVYEQSSTENLNEDDVSTTKSEITALELEKKETDAYIANHKETLSAKREHNKIVIKQLNEVNKQKFEKQKKLEQLQHLEREYAELEKLQRDSGIVQEAFTVAHKDFQKRSACPKCGTNAYGNAEKDAGQANQEE